MKNTLKNLLKRLDLNSFHSKEEEKLVYKEIIDGIISATSGSDLKVMLDKLNNYDWYEPSRHMFLLGLMQGALMQFKKDVSVEELKNLFYEI